MIVSSRLAARSGLLFVSAAAALWGTAGVVVRVIQDHTGLPAVSVAFLRLLVAAVGLLAVLGRRRWAALRRAARREPLPLAAAGAGLALYQALYLIGVQDVGVSVSTLVSLGTAPVVLTAGHAWSRRRWPAPRQLAVVGCAVAGLALICTVSSNATTAPHPLLGVLASVGSGLGYAGSTVLNARLAATGDPLVLGAATTTVGAVLLLPFALVAGLTLRIGAADVAWLGYLGLVTTSVAYVLFFAGLRSTLTEVAAVLTLLEPLTAALLASWLRHEPLGVTGVIGAVLLLGAIALLYLRQPRRDSAVGSTIA